MKIAILGAGAWGTALALCLSRRHDVALWTRDRAQCVLLRSARTNDRYLPGHAFPDALHIVDDVAAGLDGAALVLVAVATAGLRDTLRRLAASRSAVPLVWLCKGFERQHARLPHQVCEEELDSATRRGVLTGPSFAEEVARGLPTALTLASNDAVFARETARALHGGNLRVYSGDDLVGAEVAGAVKNVMAIAAGICDGLRLGANARAALITRGLAEMTRLGVAMGGRADTFMGLAGAGDLILTCTGDLSRNRRVGLGLAQGTDLGGILADLGHVAEGVYTAHEVARIAQELHVDMPITRAVCKILEAPRRAAEIARELLERDPKPEGGG